MRKNRAFLPWRKTRELVDHLEAARTAYLLYETAWADAWPHLDDWFKKTEALLLQRDRNRPITI